jgi:hypothetical protein
LSEKPSTSPLFSLAMTARRLDDYARDWIKNGYQGI